MSKPRSVIDRLQFHSPLPQRLTAHLCTHPAWPSSNPRQFKRTTLPMVEPTIMYHPRDPLQALDQTDCQQALLQVLRLRAAHHLDRLGPSASAVTVSEPTSTQLSKVPAARPTPLIKAHSSVEQQGVRAIRQHRLLRRHLLVLLIRLRAGMRQPTSPISSLLVVKTIVSLAQDATKMTAETQDSEAADIRAGSAEGMKSLPGELLRRLWITAEILVVATTGGAGTIVTAGMVDATDVLGEKTTTLDAHCQMCKARLAVVGQFKASLHLHRHRLVHHLHQNGSVAHHAATTNPSTTDAVVAVAEAATSEARGVKTTVTEEAVGLAVKTISCSRREMVGNAGMRTGLAGLRQETSTRRGDAVAGRWPRTSWLVENDWFSDT